MNRRMELSALFGKRFFEFCNHYGDIASVLSLMITVVGFAATLYRLSRIGKESKKAEAAARQGIEKLGSQLLAFEIANLNHLMSELGLSCRERRWQSALDKCQLIRTSVTRLTSHPQLNEDERVRFRSAYDEFGTIIRYIEKNRMKGTAVAQDLPDQKQRALDALASSFLLIESRMRHSLLET